MFNYIPSPTGKAFHESDKFIKMIVGPYGSGKSCCCAIDVLSYACAQAPAPDGVRYTRVGVIRSTYPELTSMTRKSLMEVLPHDCGSITGAVAPLRGVYIIPLPDGTTVNLELNLFALKTPDDCSKILSANWTFAWINEATGVCQEVVSAVMTRIGRFPSQNLGGVSWGGILMDFNQPARGSWLDNYIKNPEPNWAVFRQPPAAFKQEDENGKVFYTINEKAENLFNLGSKLEDEPETYSSEEEKTKWLNLRGVTYYKNQVQTLLKQGREDIVQAMYCMLDTEIVDGKPVFPSFSRTKHVAEAEIEPVMFEEIIIGMDQSGVHPAAIIAQYQRDKWCVLDELYAEGEGFENFLYGILIPLLRRKYATNPVVAAIDPSNQRDSWQAITPRQRLEEAGIPAVTEITNSPKLRIHAIEHLLNMDVGGLLVSPTCELLIRAFVSEYRYRRLRASGTMGAVYTPQPEKNDASHIMDGTSYFAVYISQGRSYDRDAADNVAAKLQSKRAALRKLV